MKNIIVILTLLTVSVVNNLFSSSSTKVETQPRPILRRTERFTILPVSHLARQERPQLMRHEAGLKEIQKQRLLDELERCKEEFKRIYLFERSHVWTGGGTQEHYSIIKQARKEYRELVDKINRIRRQMREELGLTDEEVSSLTNMLFSKMRLEEILPHTNVGEHDIVTPEGQLNAVEHIVLPDDPQ